jgi:glycosyltransferase involved in cell wall biosynthesis
MRFEMPENQQNKHPLISIIIPSFNKDEYIGDTLTSIIKQNYPKLEVIIQDGGSTDQSVNIIKKFASKYKYIKWESKKDKGQLDAINKGMKKARGEILAYINADDVYEKNAFNEVSKVFLNNPAILWLVGKGRVINDKGIEIAKPVTQFKNLLLKINKYNLLLVTNYLMQPSVFISRKAYDKYGSFTGVSSFITEYEMWLKIGVKQMPYVCDKYLSSFRLASGSITSSDFKHLLNEDVKVVEKYTKNPILIFMHLLTNIGRLFVIKIWSH